jgi:ferredoxin
MPSVVTESCIKCKYTECVSVCPADCFHEGPNFLVIDPAECMNCTLCIVVCPVDAIYMMHDVPADQQHFIALNAELSASWPGIKSPQAPPADAERWKGVPDKLALLER